MQKRPNADNLKKDSLSVYIFYAKYFIAKPIYYSTEKDFLRCTMLYAIGLGFAKPSKIVKYESTGWKLYNLYYNCLIQKYVISRLNSETHSQKVLCSINMH